MTRINNHSVSSPDTPNPAPKTTPGKTLPSTSSPTSLSGNDNSSQLHPSGHRRNDASSGIGRALVITLAEPGKHLYLPARREVKLHELATTIKSLGSKSLS